MERLFSKLLIGFFFCGTAAAQTNLLLNPNADDGAAHWRVSGQATVEQYDGNKVFVVRNGGSFGQDVDINSSDVGKYALFIGNGSSERINPDGAITGLPYLYGYMLHSKTHNGATINAYLQGQLMLGSAGKPDAWILMYSIFRVPEDTIAIAFFLNQAERRNVPQNGSAARFRNVGLYLFKTEQDAMDFARNYQ